MPRSLRILPSWIRPRLFSFSIYILNRLPVRFYHPDLYSGTSFRSILLSTPYCFKFHFSIISSSTPMHTVMSSHLSQTRESFQVQSPLYYSLFSLFQYYKHICFPSTYLKVRKLSLFLKFKFRIFPYLLLWCFVYTVFFNTDILLLCNKFSFIRSIKRTVTEMWNQFYLKKIYIYIYTYIRTWVFFFKICHTKLNKTHYCTHVLNAETQFAYHWIRSSSVQQQLTCKTKQNKS